jgi:hypothetical protein
VLLGIRSRFTGPTAGRNPFSVSVSGGHGVLAVYGCVHCQLARLAISFARAIIRSRRGDGNVLPAAFRECPLLVRVEDHGALCGFDLVRLSVVRDVESLGRRLRAWAPDRGRVLRERMVDRGLERSLVHPVGALGLQQAHAAFERGIHAVAEVSPLVCRLFGSLRRKQPHH